jgi:7-cyano-7-deazaguanine synthase
VNKMIEKQKIIALLSGGIDSTVMLAQLLDTGNEILGLSFNYGQRHASRELGAVKHIANHYGITHSEKTVPMVQHGALTGNTEVPVEDYSAETQTITVVPMRNLILLGYAAGIAMVKGFDAVAYAAHASDHGVYPDCRPEFVQHLEATFQAAEGPKLITPFLKNHKWEIIALGARLNVPFDLTWTCYQGKERQCGICGSCNERRTAFTRAQVPDPTEYERET